jgi:hypothetical protein
MMTRNTLLSYGFRGCTAAAVMAVIATSAGCTRSPTFASGPSSQAAAVLNAATPVGLIAAMASAGLPAAHPRDATGQICPAAHCLAAEQTDTVSILKFSAPALAQNYDGSRQNTYQVEDVVVVFDPTVDDATRRAYERIVTRAVM